tara:strand:- start:2121 stop:3404 length:1284 start_codon:yes stop_codon:yes gene_type:complete
MVTSSFDELSLYLSAVQLISTVCVIMILILSRFATISWSRRNLPDHPTEGIILPKITLVLPTWNEELIIREKLSEIHSQDYPSELMEVIIIDANSDDSTVSVAEDWISSKNQNPTLDFKIIVEEERKGKSHSINRAFGEASPESEILMMSDVDCRLSEGSIKRICSWFSNPEVGAVTGRQVLINDESTQQVSHEENYRNFYTSTRIAESCLDSTPIFHGECSAFRRSAIINFKLVENSNADDSQMAVAVRKTGLRSIYDPKIVFFEMAPPDGRSSRIQKVRRAQGLVRHFWRNKNLVLDSNMGNFRKIIALEFSLHIFLPILVMIGFITGFAHIGLFFYENGTFVPLINPADSIESIMIIADFMVILLLFCGLIKIPIPASNLSLSFLKYMLILMEAILLAVFGKSLHKWQQVSAVREALAIHDKGR